MFGSHYGKMRTNDKVFKVSGKKILGFREVALIDSHPHRRHPQHTRKMTLASALGDEHPHPSPRLVCSVKLGDTEEDGA